MTRLETISIDPSQTLLEKAEALGPLFAARAEEADEDAFVAQNFADLKAAGFLEAGVPVELGGGGADIPELSLMLRTLARHCGSTALALAMHTHQVAIPAWRWRHQQVAAVEPLLKRVAAERLVLVSTGGADWVGGSGEAVPVEDGYRIHARKAFSSASPVGDLLMTGAVLKGDETGPGEVLHFAVPLASPQVQVLDTWRALGMRGTGSHDVLIDGHVVPAGAVSLRRRAGEWHPMFQVVATIAFPLIYSAYLGVAEAARDIAVALAARKPTPHTITAVGRLDTELMAARLAVGGMLAVVAENAPSADTVNRIMMGRTLAARHALAVGELALEAAGGAGFHRKAGLERRFRDLQGARFHPMQPGPQAEYTGRMALGMPVERVF
ncbi:acyl-CoA dehydrogenase family protein [Rubellimicrobium roseum]|uniref:Acyl-CoA dehydrogenase n=1 Tax=Rubellimicrobium roseum TaxID=687525 RepID=A0A5C4NEV5_9RHOB|nr:acyl-CoA dehydrogenase family protein [Rubellimicrobium roseum]TNC71626.1 acyl-CoA dehydrogenase [Rubellimicrobium roseum]